MRLGVAAKLGILLATLWPVAYVGWFFFAATTEANLEDHPEVIALHVATMVDFLALYAFYALHARRTQGAREPKWNRDLLLRGPLVWLPYWFKHIWKADHRG